MAIASKTEAGVSQLLEYRIQPDPVRTRNMDTADLRGHYLMERVFEPGRLNYYYLDYDRAIIGGAIPLDRPLRLEPDQNSMAAESFLERRELGVINIGGPGRISVDGADIAMATEDALYVGRGVAEVLFASDDPARPARYYLASYPAHTAYPTNHHTTAQANRLPLGSKETCNERVIHQFIHPDGIKSCQLVMGFTRLAPGSVWNTMPCHTHSRRSEVYMYYDIGEGDGNSFVVHLMGEPDQTRALIVRDGQAVVSPAWSIHSGCGTANYNFIWAMGGENQVFANMDLVPMGDLI